MKFGQETKAQDHLFRAGVSNSNLRKKKYSTGHSLLEKAFAGHNLLENPSNFAKFDQNISFCQFSKMSSCHTNVSGGPRV
jgi:hypothetical protein